MSIFFTSLCPPISAGLVKYQLKTRPTFVMRITMKISSANMYILVVNVYVIEINGIFKCCSWYTVIHPIYICT